jgi:multidrug resistance efflux pump
MRKTGKLVLVVGLITLLLFTLGCSSDEEAAQDQAADSSEEEVATINVFGTTKAKQERNLMLDLEAKIEEIHVEEGARVTKGDRLVTLDLSEVQDELASKQRELKVAKNRLETMSDKREVEIEELEAELTTKQELYERKQQRLEEKKQQLAAESAPEIKKLINKLKLRKKLYRQAEKELTRKEELLAKGAITEQEVIAFRETVDNKKEAAEEIQLTLAEVKENRRRAIEELKDSLIQEQQVIKTLKAQLKKYKLNSSQDYLTQQAKVERLTQEINQLQTKLSKDYFNDKQIVATVEKGVVSEINYKPGDFVNSEQKLFTILNIERLIVEADIPEEFIQYVEEGEGVTISPLAAEDQNYEGIIDEIRGKALERGGETVVPAKISITDADQFLRPNFNVDITINR